MSWTACFEGSPPLRRMYSPRLGAFDEFHGDVGLAHARADVVDADDVGVVDLGGGPGLAHEALPVFLGVVHEGAKELERDGTAELGVQGAVDDAHASAAQLLLELVASAEGALDGLGGPVDHGGRVAALPVGVRSGRRWFRREIPG